MPDSFRSDNPATRHCSGDVSNARRLIRAGYAPDAVRGILCLQPTDKLWGEVQTYYEERDSKHGISNS